MNRWLRPMVLVLAWGVLAGSALVLVFRPAWEGVSAAQAVPRPVPDGDQEIAWLNTATSSVSWERFVSAVQRLRKRSDLQMELDDRNAFPSQTTAVPEIAVSVGGSRSRLWIRWYKTTGDLGSKQWIEALERRSPPPLAVIGGSSSDRARDLAKELNDVHGSAPTAPLLLIPTATADQVEMNYQSRDLMQVYPGRSFRFCYTNRQMAEAVTHFIWSRDDLRPDAKPIYRVRWNDDPYSNDLFDRFREVIDEGGHGVALQGGETQPIAPFWSAPISYSQGLYSQPNSWEEEAAEKLLDELSQHPGQQRPLLILPAGPQPARRFLRALVRLAPLEAGRFVVATGDAIDLNTVYRDRHMAWPIQDMPVSLVFFSHRNPVDPSIFQPDQPEPKGDSVPGGGTATGTQDLLLYQDIVEVVLRSAFSEGRLLANAEEMRRNLRAIQGNAGRPRFDEEGNQRGGGGEYVVCLKPVRVGERVRPQAILQVWHGSLDARSARQWTLARTLDVDYKRTPGMR